LPPPDISWHNGDEHSFQRPAVGNLQCRSNEEKQTKTNLEPD
jgi:hypothetical protein